MAACGEMNGRARQNRFERFKRFMQWSVIKGPKCTQELSFLMYQKQYRLLNYVGSSIERDERAFQRLSIQILSTSHLDNACDRRASPFVDLVVSKD